MQPRGCGTPPISPTKPIEQLRDHQGETGCDRKRYRDPDDIACRRSRLVQDAAQHHRGKGRRADRKTPEITLKFRAHRRRNAESRAKFLPPRNGGTSDIDSPMEPSACS
jgi:hypothetical protein